MAHLLIRNTVLPDRRLPLPGKVIVLGRNMDSDVPIRHPSVSRRHALLECVGGDYRISDLGSSNGTFVGEERLESGARVAVPLGARFRVGQVEIVLAKDESIEEPARATAAALPAAAAGKPVASPSPPPARPSSVSIHPTSKEKRSGRLSPAVAQRAKLRKQKSNMMRWFGVVMTVVLIALAGFFISRIVERRGEKPGEKPAEEKQEPKKEEMEVRPLGE